MLKNPSCLILAATLFTTSALADGISANLTTSKKSVDYDSDVTFTLTLTNEETHPVKVLDWFTAEKGIKEPLFSIELNGESVDYQGPHYKRPAPGANDYVHIAAGESVSYKVELSSVYDLKQSGTYDIQYHAESINLLSANPAQSEKLAQQGIDGISSNKVSVWIEGRGLVGHDPISVYAKPEAGSISFSGQCSNSQRSDIMTALTAAQNMADNSLNYLQNYPSSSRSQSVRYDTWFGNYSSSRWNRVTNNFSAIKDATNNQALQFDCSCNQGYFAYVYSNQPYKIYMCNAFWSAATTGTDSKAGTIIHELSHFNVVAGTDDLAYGHSNAKALANSRPGRATRNADSHEYFAENTPAQN